MGKEDYPEGIFNRDKVEQIRLANYPITIRKEDLPEDAELITEYRGPDDDNDRGGSRIRNSKDFMRQHHETMMEIEKEKETKKKIRGEGEVPLLYETRRGNDDDDDDEDKGGMALRVSQRSMSSEDYRNEIENLRTERDVLWQELKEKEKLIPDIQREFETKNEQFEEAMAKMNEELQLIKDIESSAKEDYRQFEIEYRNKVRELEQANLGRKNMGIEIESLRNEYNINIERLKQDYSEALRESQGQMNELKNYYEELLQNTKREVEQLSSAAWENKDLRLNLDRERTEATDLRTALQELKLKYLELENIRFQDIEELTKALERQRENYSEARESEVSELKQHLNSVESQKNAIQLQYDKLINDYQTSVNIINNKDKEIESVGQQSEKGKQEVIKQAEEFLREKDQTIQEQNLIIDELTRNIQRLKQQQQQYDSEKPQLLMPSPSNLPLSSSSNPIKESTTMEIQYPKPIPKQEETKIEEEKPKPRKQEVINVFDRDYGIMKTYYNQILERKGLIKNMSNDEKQEMQNALTTAINFGNNLLKIIPNNNAKLKLNAEISTWMNELNRIRANDDLRIGASVGTRSQGPVLIGEEIQTNFLDEKGNLIYKGKMYELGGRQYTTPEYVLNLIMHARSSTVKAFKDSFIENQKQQGDTSTYNNSKLVNKSVEILHDALGNDSLKVAIMMKHIIDKYPNNIYKEFKTTYTNEYANLIPKKT